jgi:hypothetical protein
MESVDTQADRYVQITLLLDFAVNRHLTQDRVVFFEFEAVRRVLAVLLRYVTRSTRLTGCFVLSAFQNDLVAVTFTFLSHFGLFWERNSNPPIRWFIGCEADIERSLGLLKLNSVLYTFCIQFLQVSNEAQLVDGADSTSGNAQCNEFTRLRNEETFLLDVGYKTTLGLPVGVRHIVSGDRLLARKGTNFRHGCRIGSVNKKADTKCLPVILKVTPPGFEPGTSASVVRYSIQLSYGAILLQKRMQMYKLSFYMCKGSGEIN